MDRVRVRGEIQVKGEREAQKARDKGYVWHRVRRGRGSKVRGREGNARDARVRIWILGRRGVVRGNREPLETQGEVGCMARDVTGRRGKPEEGEKWDVKIRQ